MLSPFIYYVIHSSGQFLRTGILPILPLTNKEKEHEGLKALPLVTEMLVVVDLHTFHVYLTDQADREVKAGRVAAPHL